MKINSLLQEGITAASSPENATNSAPTMGRSDKFLEDQVDECTASGSVASVAAPVGKMQRRGKGSIFSGISTSKKFPNSKAVKESVNPQNFDSDVDYYNAVKKQGQQQFSGDWDVWDEIASLENQIKYTKSSALAHQLYKQIDQLKQQAGIEDDEDEYEKEYDADIRARKGLEEAGFTDTIKRSVKNIKRGLQGWDKNLEGPGGEKLGDPKEIVRRNKSYSDDTTLQLAKRKELGFPFGGDSTTGEHTPRGLQRKVLDREIKRRGLSPEQEVAEDQLDEKSVSKAQFRTMAAVAHNPKFAKKVGISQRVGKEFHKADRKQDYKDLPSKVDEAEIAEDMLAHDLYRDLQIFKKGADKDIGSKAKDKEISGKAKDKEIINKVKKATNEDKDPCWDGYKQIGMKKKGGKQVPNCVPKK